MGRDAETIEVTGKVGVWHVRIKQPDKTKTIFHIDSSYEKVQLDRLEG